MVCGLSPLVTGFVGVVLKDVIYSAFFVLFVVFCTRFAEKTSFCLSMGDVIGLGASGICVVLLRNNGKYVMYRISKNQHHNKVLENHTEENPSII